MPVGPLLFTQLPAPLVIQAKDLTISKFIGKFSLGTVHAAQWQGQSVIYKRIASLSSKGRENFKKEFSVWQYVTFTLLFIC